MNIRRMYTCLTAFPLRSSHHVNTNLEYMQRERGVRVIISILITIHAAT